jgi:hypothetical protein
LEIENCKKPCFCWVSRTAQALIARTRKLTVNNFVVLFAEDQRRAMSQAAGDSEVTDMNNEDFWDDAQVRTFFGGSGNPIHRSTLHKGVVAGRFPRPVKIGTKMKRWLASECRACRDRMVAARDAQRGAAADQQIAQ